jgi:hypothetical protein
MKQMNPWVLFLNYSKELHNRQMPVMVNKEQLISPEITGIIVNTCSVAYDNIPKPRRC